MTDEPKFATNKVEHPGGAVATATAWEAAAAWEAAFNWAAVSCASIAAFGWKIAAAAAAAAGFVLTWGNTVEFEGKITWGCVSCDNDDNVNSWCSGKIDDRFGSKHAAVAAFARSWACEVDKEARKWFGCAAAATAAFWNIAAACKPVGLCIIGGGGVIRFGFDTFVLLRANSRRIVCVLSGSNRTPCNAFRASSAASFDENVTKPTGVAVLPFFEVIFSNELS